MNTLQKEIDNLSIKDIEALIGRDALGRIEEEIKESKALQEEYELINQARKVNRQRKEKKTNITSELEKEIDIHQKMTDIYKETSTSKEAYEHIVGWPKLRFMTPYSQYASLYVLDKIEGYIEEHNHRYVTIEPMIRYANDLPHLYITVRHPLFTKSVYILPEHDNLVDLKKVFEEDKVAYLNLRITQNLNSIKRYKTDLSNYEEKLKQTENVLFSLIVKKKRKKSYQERVRGWITEDKRSLAHCYSKLKEDSGELDAIKGMDKENAKEIIKSELYQIVAFLTNELKYDISIEPLGE